MDAKDTPALFAGAATAFGQYVHAVGPTQWDDPTPCTEWSVRDLVNHLTSEDLWAVELFDGRTIADVGSQFDGDLLGADPVARCDTAISGAIHAISQPSAMTDTVHLSFGDLPGSEYTMQLFADHLVHAWDLAMAIGRNPEFDNDLVVACRDWFTANEAGYRSAGIIAERPELPEGADDLAQLVVAFGRSPDWQPPAT
jgi:uncharacterized protein (TIGR03086 family)